MYETGLIVSIDYGIVPSEHFLHAADVSDVVETVVPYVSGERTLQEQVL